MTSTAAIKKLVKTKGCSGASRTEIPTERLDHGKGNKDVYVSI